MRVLVACEFSGIVRDAFAARGNDAWSCDLLPTERIGNHIIGDVLEMLGERWDLMLAFPPCTHLSASGARWFTAKRADGRQQQGIDFFMALVNAPIPHIAVENPIGIMSRVYRKSDQIIQPWQFGHGETKATCLWLTNLPRLEPTRIVTPHYHINKDGTDYRDSRGKRDSARHFLSGRLPENERQKIRSRTFQGVADAMAAQWSITTEG